MQATTTCETIGSTTQCVEVRDDVFVSTDPLLALGIAIFLSLYSAQFIFHVFSTR